MVNCQAEFSSAFPFDDKNYQFELMVICQAEFISGSPFVIANFKSGWVGFLQQSLFPFSAAIFFQLPLALAKGN
jgi:hypothetical protein